MCHDMRSTCNASSFYPSWLLLKPAHSVYLSVSRSHSLHLFHTLHCVRSFAIFSFDNQWRESLEMISQCFFFFFFFIFCDLHVDARAGAHSIPVNKAQSRQNFVCIFPFCEILLFRCCCCCSLRIEAATSKMLHFA